MIKRIYYYFKLKELLKMKDLLSFVEYTLKCNHKESLFKICMKHRIRFWFDSITPDNNVLRLAELYAEFDKAITLSITKRFRQARDIWMKQKIY